MDQIKKLFENKNFIKSAEIGLVCIVFLVIFSIMNKTLFSESFFFEVSPWKKNCLQCGDSKPSGCCGKGFHGMKLPPFEYIDDNCRVDGCPPAGCS
jgi:hypothetical protein